MNLHLKPQGKLSKKIVATHVIIGFSVALLTACGAKEPVTEAPTQQNVETLIVIEARNSGLAPGATIQSDSAVTIPANGFIRLITPAGRVMKVTGPLEGPLAAVSGSASRANAADANNSARWRKVYSAMLEKSETTALAVRAAKPGSEGEIDITNGGNFCVVGNSEIQLTATAPGYGTQLKIATGEQVSELPWSADQTRAALPDGLLQPGTNQLSFSFMDGAVTSDISIHLFGNETIESAIEMLNIDGCADVALNILSEAP